MPRALGTLSLLISSTSSSGQSGIFSSSSQALPVPGVLPLQQQQGLVLSSTNGLGFEFRQQQQQQLKQGPRIPHCDEDSAADDELPGDDFQPKVLALEHRSAPALNTVMIIYRERGSIDEALLVWDSFRESQLLPDFLSYCIAISLFQLNRDARRALRAYRDARQQFLGLNSTGIQPEASEEESFTRKQDLQENEAFLQENASTSDNSPRKDHESGTEEAIEKLGSTVLDLCLEKLTTGLASSENRFVLQNLFVKMQHARLPISRPAACNLLLQCGIHPDDHAILRSILAFMSSRRMPLTTELCNHAIRVFGFHKKFWSALAVYEEMDPSLCNNETFSLLRSHFGCLIASAKRRNNWKWALRLLERMEQRKIRPGKISWDSAIITCARAGRVDEAVELFQRMIRWRYKPDIHSFSALLSALEKKGLVPEMNRVLESMRNSGVERTESIYTTMIAAYGKLGLGMTEIETLVKEMKSSGIGVSVVSFNAILTACAIKGDAEAAVNWMRRMREEGVEPNSISYNKLIEAFAAGNRWREAIDAYLFMVEMEMRPSPLAYDAVARASRLNGARARFWIGPRPQYHIRSQEP